MQSEVQEMCRRLMEAWPGVVAGPAPAHYRDKVPPGTTAVILIKVPKEMDAVAVYADARILRSGIKKRTGLLIGCFVQRVDPEPPDSAQH